MATFTSLLNTLPDPNNGIADAGQSGTTKGPGYSGVKLSSEHIVSNSRTNSGRLISRESAGHKWNISISYNPLTRDEFEPVYTFLLQKRGSLSPFFVSLPQYKVPRDSNFATFVASNTINNAATTETAAGLTNLMVEGSGFSTVSNGSAKPGDIFTISDDSHDIRHTKAYQVTRVETHDDYEANTTRPDSDQQRIHFIPALQRSVSSSATLVFNDPKFRVIMKKDIQQYDLNTENLYSFSLELEEAQP